MSSQYTINGIQISFPTKAYPSQIAMMNKIIYSLTKGQHSLLESPTGSGKTLALLCAALAWQRNEAEKNAIYNSAVQNGILEPELISPAEIDETMILDSEENDGFVVTTHDNETDERSKNKQNKFCQRKILKKKVPKIYFGTRTHRQISQVIRELKKTEYKNVKMSILGSREHTCIHAQVSKMKSKTEGCKDLFDRTKGGNGCILNTNIKTKLSSHEQLNSIRVSSSTTTTSSSTTTTSSSTSISEPWDLEDLVKVGKKVRACPYFASRELALTSDIIFCPYNYIIEPSIRKSLDLKLKGQILLLDEAHNIEDSARSASSFSFTQDSVRDAMGDCEDLKKVKSSLDSYHVMATLLSSISNWMDSSLLTDYKDFGSSSRIWTGTEILGVYNSIGIDPCNLNIFKDHLKKINEEQNSVMKDEEVFGRETEYSFQILLRSSTLSLLERLFYVLSQMMMFDGRHRDDFRVALTKSMATLTGSGSESKKGKNDWLPKKPHSSTIGYVLTANFWCLNPALSFLELKDELRAIVLTSGTLSPIASFSSELGIPFPIQLEANHVIDKSQVWIGTLSSGPSGCPLNATFKNTESFVFQDEVGKLVCQICFTIPHGILLFLPSYKMLSKLSERWSNTGIMKDISKRKIIVTEPRYASDLESSMRHFYDIIQDTKYCQNGGIDGALFMAVCRGKVSEGLDFVDNNARAVICIGIPFPNVRDIQVDLKKKFNDQKRNDNSEMLSGCEWYEIQAFRALNQALGRCIRHKNDWGAIIMVDDRYSKIPRYINSLSKWVRSGVHHYHKCDVMLENLVDFNAKMILRDSEREIKDKEEKTQSVMSDSDVSDIATNNKREAEFFFSPVKITRKKKKKTSHLNYSDEDDDDFK